MTIRFNTIEHLQSKFDQMTPLVYVLTEDEHRSILGIHKISQMRTGKYQTEVFVYKSTTGILSIDQYKAEIDEKKGAFDKDTAEINNAFIHIYKQNKRDRRQIYIITEADHHLEDQQIVRRAKDFSVQADNSDSNLKIIVLMSAKLHLPEKLEKYVDVVVYPYPSEDEIAQEIEDWIGKFNQAVKDTSKHIEVRKDFEIINSLKGLIIPQIRRSLTACITQTRQQGKGCLDPVILNELKRETINKTSLIKYREPKVSFEGVGGLGRLKKWFRKMRGGWTNEGRKFGLPILKGCLLIGLPGCGKSRICEALASDWHLNLIQFDPSRVFSSRVGESEGNMHLVLARIESLAPCILFIDEIEKALAGIQSSSMSDAGTTARTIGIFLIWMNDSESSVFTVATCNQIHFMPPELISRFNEIFYVGVPDRTEREEIIAIQLKEQGDRDPKKLNLDIPMLAGACENLAGREIKHAIIEAMYTAFNESKSDLTNDLLKDALRRKIPVVKTMEKQLEYLIKWVGYDEERKDGKRARFANNEMDDIDILFKEVLAKADSDQSCSPQGPGMMGPTPNY